ncbi:MAG TPA: GPW/gp25 family protein [Polyangiaceae bacterium]|jgi:phage baseplate assembly protein W|nr:GPW/gp25 family protein [Polyangiaceae bacterium]
MRTPASPNFSFPFRSDRRGRTASSDLEAQVRELIEQVLFTSPGERVNRPTFGSPLRQAVFTPASAELGAALQHLVQGALQRFLSEQITVQAVEVSAEDNRLMVEVRYLLQRNREPAVVRFEREL